MKTEQKQSTGEDARVIFSLQERPNKLEEVSLWGSGVDGSCRARSSIIPVSSPLRGHGSGVRGMNPVCASLGWI